MKIDLNKLRPKKKVYFYTNTLGKLYVFFLSGADLQNLRQDFPEGIEKADPKVLIRILIKYVCHPEDKLDEGEYKPSYPSLRDQQINEISEEELETFAEKYLQNNESLFREYIDNKKDEDGKEVISFELGEIKHPKRGDESYINYLHRLLVIQDKEIFNRNDMISKQFQTFSDTTLKQIKETFSAGDILKNTLVDRFSKDKLLHLTVPEITSFTNTDNLYIPPPGTTVSDKVNELISVSEESGRFLVRMNETQTIIANELNKSGKQTFYLSLTVLIVTLISLITNTLFMYKSHQSAKEQNAIISSGIIELKNNTALKDSLLNIQIDLIKNINHDIIEKTLQNNPTSDN